MPGVLRWPRRPDTEDSCVSGGGASDPAELLRRLRARGGGCAGTAEPSSTARAASAGALGGSNPGGPAAAPAPGAPAAALLRAAEDAAAALAAPDPDLDRERGEIAAGLRVEAPDPARAGRVEVLANGTRLHHCRVCGRLAAWGVAVASARGRDGIWLCYEHKGRAG